MVALAVQQMPYGECFDGKKAELEWKDDDERDVRTEPEDGDGVGCLPSQDLNVSFNSFDGSVSDVSLGVIPARSINSVLPGGIGGSSADCIEFAKVEKDLIRSERGGSAADSTVELTGGELVHLDNIISPPNPEEANAAFYGAFNRHHEPLLNNSLHKTKSCWRNAEESAGSAHNPQANVHHLELHDLYPNPPAAEARPPPLAVQPHDERLQDANVMSCVNDEKESVCISDTVAFHDESEWGSIGSDDEAATINNEKCINTSTPSSAAAAAAAASQHSPPPSSECFLNTSDGKVIPAPQSDLVRRALHGLPRQQKQRQQVRAHDLNLQATKKAAFNHRIIVERLAELEREKASVAKELERVKCIRRSQEAELSTIKHQKASVKQWVESEREITNRWCAEQKSRTAKECKQALKQAHLSRARLRAGTLAMGEDKKEIERLKAELEVQLERIEVLQKKSKITERRAQRKISSLEERLRDSNEQVEHLERQRVELLMVSFSSKRQSQFPRHHTSTARFPSKGYKKGDEEGERVGGGDNCEIMKRKDVNEEDVATVGQSKKQVKNASDDVSSKDDAGMEPEDVEKLSIQSQSEFQPLLRGMCTAPVCISAEDKKDVHDESGRLVAVSKAEVECLLLSSKQAAYGNGEKRTPQEKTVSLNVHEEVEATTTTAGLSPAAAYNPHRYQWLSTCGGGAKENNPISKEATMPQDSNIVVANEGNNKPSAERFEDIQSVVQFANGTKKEIWKCGKAIVHFTNGDSRITEVNGTVVYHYAEANVMQSTFADGHKLVEFPSGQKEEHFVNGTKKVQFSDGSTAMIRSDGIFDSACLQ